MAQIVTDLPEGACRLEKVHMTMGGDIVANLIAGFVTDGLRRAYRNLSGQVSRRHILTKLLQDKGAGAPTSPEYERAMGELKRVIAHGLGQYTEPVADFFRELHKTAIPDALVQHALAATPPEPLFAAFDKIYEACKPLPFESRPLFEALSAVIALRIQDGVQDKALYDEAC